MNLKNLFNKADAFLNSDERSRKEKKKCIKHVLKKLRKYEDEINKQLEDTPEGEAREQLQKKIAVTHAQRKKGMSLLKALKKPRDDSKKQR